MNPWILSLLFFTLHTAVVANTEIVNFDVPHSNEVDIVEAAHWPILHYEENQQQWSVLPAPLNTPLDLVCEPPLFEKRDFQSTRSTADSHRHTCPHELWVVLDFDHARWKSYHKFTLRISWPASAPTDFSIQIYDPESLLARFGACRDSKDADETSTTRRKYARIRLVDTGVRTHVSPKPIQSAPVPFIVILEPLYFGVLPATVVPTLVFLVPVLAMAGLAVPSINTYLEGVANQAKRDIHYKEN